MLEDKQGQQSGGQNDDPPPPLIHQELITNGEKGNHAIKIIKKD